MVRDSEVSEADIWPMRFGQFGGSSTIYSSLADLAVQAMKCPVHRRRHQGRGVKKMTA